MFGGNEFNAASVGLQAIVKFAAGVALTGVLLFWPAGSWAYYNGWLLMGVLFVPMMVVGVVLMVRNPKLLERRMQHKEKQREQSAVVRLSGLMFVAGFVLAGLGARYGWYVLPMWVSVVAAVVLLLAYQLYAEVLRENTYLSRTIEVQEGQMLVDTGLYGVVRHPMYSATVLMFMSMPLVLGSLPAFVLFLSYPALIVVRIRGEERLLETELKGYQEYKMRVKYRLIPHLW